MSAIKELQMPNYVTHADLNRVREGLHNDHTGLSKSMERSFTRVHEKLDQHNDKRTSGLRWVIGIVIALFTTLMGIFITHSELLAIHLQHSARYEEMVNRNEARIEKLEEIVP